MKIFMCDNRLGGLLGFRADIIRHFIEAGHEVCLVAPPATTDWDKVGIAKSKGLRIVEVAMQPSQINPVSDLKLTMQYYRLFRRERPDIVFNYTIKPNIYACIAARMAGAYVVDMLAGLGYMFNGKGLVRWVGRTLYRMGLSFAHKVLTLNEGNRDVLLSHHFVSPQKLILLKGGEGINLEEYPYTPCSYTSPVTFFVISRVLYDKGYQEVVDATEIVKKQHPEIKVEWLGPTDYASPMGVSQSVLESDTLKGVITYLGVTDNVQSYLERQSIVILLPSYHEGMSRSLMEACAKGRPIITSDIPGCRETVEHGVNGYLVPKADSAALADAMLSFLSLPAEKQSEMAHQSRCMAEKRFDVRKVIEIYDSILASIKS